MPLDLTALLQEKSAVIAGMPHDEESRDVYERVLQLWQKGSGSSEPESARAVAIEFRDSPLGLFACQDYLGRLEEAGARDTHRVDAGAEVSQDDLLPPELKRSGPASAFCWEVCRTYPESRLACMALDRILEEYSPHEAVKVCDVVFNAQGDTRSGVFVLIRQGDFLYETGRLKEAEKVWRGVWTRSAERAPQIFRKLNKAWIETGDWSSPALFDEELLHAPVWQGVIDRIGEREKVWPPSLVEAVGCVGLALRAAGVRQLTAAMKELESSLENAAVPAPHKADLALACFLLDTKRYVGSVTVDWLKAQSDIEQARADLLATALVNFESLPPDLRAAYRGLAARRMLLDVQVERAVELLDSVWKDPEVSVFWRYHTLGKAINLLVHEKAQPADAARRLAQYAEMFSDNRLDILARAGSLYYSADQFREAETALDKIDVADLPEGSEVCAQVYFLKGSCRLKDGDLQGAETYFARILNEMPSSYYGGSALHALAVDAYGRGDVVLADKYLAEVDSRYPSFRLRIQQIPEKEIEQ
jgi:tetratricopeptide (TPR) repeat protein